MRNDIIIKMFIYVATTPYLRQFFIWKIGCTKYPNLRLATYLTGCPPNMTPSNDMIFDGLWETNAQTHEELEDIEDRVHDYFLEYRLQRYRPGDSEWFNFQGQSGPEKIAQFFAHESMKARIKRTVPHDEIKNIIAEQSRSGEHCK